MSNHTLEDSNDFGDDIIDDDDDVLGVEWDGSVSRTRECESSIMAMSEVYNL